MVTQQATSHHFTRQGDGTRKIDEKAKSSGRALAGLVLVDPGMTPSVVPLGGFVYFDYNAFGRGVQVNALVAGVFNTINLAIPRGLGGFDVSASAMGLLL